MNSPGARRRLKSLLGAGWRTVLRSGRRRGKRRVVLAYHGIGDTPHSVAAIQFGEQMEWLRDNAAVLGLEELLTGRSEAPLSCAITFDDGYASVYENAFPVLSKLGFPAAMYVTTDAVNEEHGRDCGAFAGLRAGEKIVTWRQLREMQSGAVVVGSHLCHHFDLTALSEAKASVQLSQSKTRIAEKLGSCEHFAFPFGRYTRATADLVERAGYRTAVTVAHSPLPSTLDLFRIPRMVVRRGYSVRDFEAMVSGDWDYMFVVQMARQLAGRKGLGAAF